MAALNCYMLKLLHAKSMRVRLYTSLPSHQAVCVYIRMYNLSRLFTHYCFYTYVLLF